MKKLIVAVLFSSILICNVNAFTNDLEIIKSNYYVCDNNTKYPIYDIKQNNFHYYFLNMNETYNFDFRDYNQIEFSNTTYNERVRAFTSYKSMFLSKPNYEELYNPFVNLMIYRYLNNNDELFLCDKDMNRITYDSSYEDDYQRIKDIIDGPNFDNPIKVVPNKDYLLEDNNLSFYNYEAPDELNSFRPNLNTILINANKGNYDVVFHYQIFGSLGELYSDNANSLLKEGTPAFEDFHFNIIVDDPTLYIYNHTNENIDLSSLCFNLVGNNYFQTFCSSQEGIASIQAPVGIYNLEILSNINNDYSGNHIAINNVEEVININWGENETPNDDNNIGFIPSDTLELSGIIIALITMLGVGFAIKKTQ